MKRVVMIGVVVFWSLSVFAQQQTFVLCEGNFNTPNASLWCIDGKHHQVGGPLHWDENSNPLGDTGQSLTIHNDKLYIVVNNSHSVEVMDLSSGEPLYETTIPVSFASPRYLEVIDNFGYLSCWYVPGILKVDLSSNAIVDTIFTEGLPEDMVAVDDKLYVTINMKADWSSSNQVLQIDTRSNPPAITNQYEVVPGPSRIIAKGNLLYISSTYYDANWYSYFGLSEINIENQSVRIRDYGQTFSYGTDLTTLNGEIYVSYSGGAVPLSDSLMIDESRKIGNFPNLYSMSNDGSYFYFGLSNYVAPDTVAIVDQDGNIVHQYTVGAIPGDFAFYSLPTSIVSDIQSLTPDHFTLYQNYPNPFNAETRIPYSLSRQSDVRIRIFDILGREVFGYYRQNQSPGDYQIVWNGRSNYGPSLTSGTYLYRIDTKSGAATRRMSYLK